MAFAWPKHLVVLCQRSPFSSFAIYNHTNSSSGTFYTKGAKNQRNLSCLFSVLSCSVLEHELAQFSKVNNWILINRGDTHSCRTRKYVYWVSHWTIFILYVLYIRISVRHNFQQDKYAISFIGCCQLWTVSTIALIFENFES